MLRIDEEISKLLGEDYTDPDRPDTYVDEETLSKLYDAKAVIWDEITKDYYTEEESKTLNDAYDIISRVVEENM